jgi:tetratricopeptide (TPR) repeat protein
MDPAYAPAWAHLGVAKTVLINSRNDPQLGPQDLPQALADVRKAIALDPLVASSWRVLSFTLDSGQHADEAVQAAERAVELGPGDPENWLAVALAQYHARQHNAAVRNLDKAIAWNRGLRPKVYIIVEARVRYAIGDYAHALRSAGERIDRVPVLVVCKAIWLSAQMRLGHIVDAQAAWPRLVSAAPFLESYRYAPCGTPEARAIDEDLDRLRGRTREAQSR